MDKKKLIKNFIIAKQAICDRHDYCDNCEINDICQDPTDLKNTSTIVSDTELRYFLGADTELTKEDVEVFFDNRRDICTNQPSCRYCPINEGEPNSIVDNRCSFVTGEISPENFAYIWHYDGSSATIQDYSKVR